MTAHLSGHLLYADGAETGDAANVEFDDWQAQTEVREVNFLWPDGTELDKETEYGFGDHVIFMPTQDIRRQVMHMKLTGFDNGDNPQMSVGTATALLVNP